MKQYGKASELIGFIVGSTNRAVFFQDHFWHQGRWLPKSQLRILSSDGEHRVSVSAWLCEQANLNEFTEVIEHE